MGIISIVLITITIVPSVAGGNQVSINEANDEVARTYRKQIDSQAKELFLPFRCFCTRKEVISAACFIFKSPFH
jgi:hypothetical protein